MAGLFKSRLLQNLVKFVWRYFFTAMPSDLNQVVEILVSIITMVCLLVNIPSCLFKSSVQFTKFHVAYSPTTQM